MSVWEEASERPDLLLLEVKDGVAVITLNRPERLNAWTPALGTRYFDTLEQLARDGEVRAIVVTGAGRAFCSGADGSGLQGLAAQGGMTAPREQRAYWHPLKIGKPIIAAINGACFGIGFQQALCCDIRFVADDAKLSTAYARRGLMGECGITWMLPRIVGVGNAADLLLSGRVVRADEALRIGLANRVVPAGKLLEETCAYARMLAQSCAPWSMRTMKQQLYRDLMSDLSGSFDQASVFLRESMRLPDFAEGVRSWVEKRDPKFQPLAADLAMLDLPDPRRNR